MVDKNIISKDPEVLSGALVFLALVFLLIF